MSRRIRTQPSMLEGPIWKGLISFAIPILLGNLFQQLYNTADTLIVGNFIGKDALAAVSSSASLIHLMVGFLQGTAMGAGVLIARYYGAKDPENMSRAIHTGLTFALLGGLLLTVLGTTLTPVILRWMGTPESVLPNSVVYFRTYFLGVSAVFLYNMCTGILRNVGDSRRPLYYLILSSLLNVGLDLLFVAVFRWGVSSAALATVISQAVSALLCLWQLTRTRESHRVQLRKLGLHLPTLREIIRFGLPSGAQGSFISFANVIVQTNINAFGADAMAGCGSYAKIEGFAFLPVTCFSMGLATFVGQNLGAKQYDRVKAGCRFGLSCSVGMSLCISACIFFLAPYLIPLFNNDPSVVAFGVQQARVISWFYFLMAVSHCYAGILRGAGRSTVPMLVMLVCWCLIRITYITIVVHFVPNINVVFSAYPLTWTCSTIAFTVYYHKADWLHHFDRLEARKKTI